eukprot:scpid86833/ scgid23567/ 
MATAGARAVMKVARPAVMRGKCWSAFRRTLLVGVVTCFIPGMVYDHYFTNPRIKSYRDFYTDYNPNKDAWDFVYDAFIALDQPVPVPPWLEEEEEDEDDDE